MTTYPHSTPEAVQASGTAAVAALCPKPTGLKAQAKALKKWRKHERLRFFFSWCAGCHALGFSF
jgi:hypothetical protein